MGREKIQYQIASQQDNSDQDFEITDREGIARCTHETNFNKLFIRLIFLFLILFIIGQNYFQQK